MESDTQGLKPCPATEQLYGSGKVTSMEFSFLTTNMETMPISYNYCKIKLDYMKIGI